MVERIHSCRRKASIGHIVPRGVKHGYKDDNQNEWVPHYPASGREEDFHWDVQHPDGSHTNVALMGKSIMAMTIFRKGYDHERH